MSSGKKKKSRNTHAGRNPHELDSYKKYVFSSSSSESTLLMPNKDINSDLLQTDESSEHKEIIENDTPQFRKDPNSVKIKDWFFENAKYVIVVIVLPVLGWLCLEAVKNHGEIRVHEEKLLNIDKQLGKVDADISEIESELRNLREDSLKYKMNFDYIEKDIDNLRFEINRIRETSKK